MIGTSPRDGLLSACQIVGIAVPTRTTMPVYQNIKAIAEKDKFVPPEAQAKILEGLKGHAQASVYVYPGVDHAFARMGGHSWDARAATIANGRTAELLAKVLG